MTLKMTNNTFNFFYYSQIQLVLIAMALTAAASAVLLGSIIWDGIWIVGLSTFVTYSVDNLIDWNQDLKHYQDIKSIIQYYHKFCYIAVPLCVLGIGSLIIKGDSVFQVGIILLCATTVITISRIPIHVKVLTITNDFIKFLAKLFS